MDIYFITIFNACKGKISEENHCSQTSSSQHLRCELVLKLWIIKYAKPIFIISFYLPLGTYSTEEGIEYNCTGKPGHHIKQLIRVSITWTVTSQDKLPFQELLLPKSTQF